MVSMNQFKLLSLYGFTILFNALVSFTTFSILTHYLTETDYGIISLYTSVSAFLLPFIAVGVQYIIGIDYFKLSGEDFRKHFTNAIFIPVLTTFFFTIVFLFANQFVQKFINVNFFFAVALPFTCFLTIISDIFLTLLRNSSRHSLFMGFSMIKNSIEAGLVLLFVIALGYHWEGRLGASVLTLFPAFLFVGYMMRRWKYGEGKVDKNAVIRNFRAGLPFIPERLAIFVLLSSDRFFINHFSGLAKVGLYGAGAQLAVIISS
jgi:O-antigen/teichoic acid export membrane protein